jgi:subtilisin family serine protease
MKGNVSEDRYYGAFEAHRIQRAYARTDIAVNESSGQEYLYRPRELLVALQDLGLVESELERWRPERRETIEGLGLTRLILPPEVDIPALVSRLRAPPEGRVPRVGPNHVFSGEPAYQGGPAGFPTSSTSSVTFGAGTGGRVRVATLDTGFASGLHPALDARCRFTPADAEQLNVLPADGWLDSEAGHGTFIAGVVLQRAPGAIVDIAKVLDSEGYGDELDVGQGIVRFAKDNVLNLSLGCYSHGDVPPLGLVEALRRVARGSVVVAAAGNNSSDRLMWPAALKSVIGVAALDASGKARAPFSNYGWWVDCCAPAVDVLSSFVEFREAGGPGPNRPPQSFAGWATWSGTSFAAPKVAGEIAALKTSGGFRTAREAADELLAKPERLADMGTVLDL